MSLKESRFQRLEMLVGPAGMDRLRHASVAVFGVGGVGGYAVEALARAGVGRLTLIDYDDVSITNVNRQIHALDGTVGRPKVTVMAERCRAINPDVRVEPLKIFYAASLGDELLGRGYDYVLDCIDTITAKLSLIERCRVAGLPVISSMGAANKLDPTLIEVADIALTRKCRLARTIRRELRKRGIETGVKVVFSTEEFHPLQGPDAKERTPTLGSSSYVPPLFGLTMAGVVIQELSGAGAAMHETKEEIV